VELDTSDLPAEQAAAVENAVRGLSGHLPSAPPRPDAFRYEITPLDDPDLPSASIAEGDVPAELTGLIEHLERTGEIEERKAHPDG
jgi:hypothetical protein